MPMLPPHAKSDTFRPEMLAALIIVHGAALAAPFTFSWQGLIAFVIMTFATGCLGITLCYHRLLSHRSFKVKKWVKYFLMLCGTLTLEGDPCWWAATHRLHHMESDQEKDPHSPRVSFLWAHVLWLLYSDRRMQDRKVLERFIPDLVNDPWAKFLGKFFLPINLAFLAGLYALGNWMGGAKMGLSLLVWGGFLRIMWVWHITWFVNSVTHVWGYRNYETRDDSRNIWWVAICSFGEGWHNNHHANPSAAKSGHRWWEFDLTYCIIKALEITGLAWRVLPVVPAQAAVVRPMPSEGKRVVANDL
jgi:fatty-acid desaturase